VKRALFPTKATYLAHHNSTIPNRTQSKINAGRKGKYLNTESSYKKDLKDFKIKVHVPVQVITMAKSSAETIISELWIYPVKACQGIQVESVTVTETG
jgi:hypothetical protein